MVASSRPLARMVTLRHQAPVILLLTAALMAAVTSALAPAFATPENLSNLLIQATPLALASIGQTFVILARGADLSIGSVVGLTVALLATSPGRDLPVPLSIPLLLVVGGLVGAFNGTLVTRWRVQPLVATLATMIALQGATLWILPEPKGQTPEVLRRALNRELLGVHTGVWLLAVVAVGALVVLHRLPFGRHIYAVGRVGPAAARMLGVRSGLVEPATYVMSALLATATGIFMAARLGSGDPNVGTPLLFQSFTAVVMGGTPFSGGEGGVTGTLAASLLLAVVNNGFNLMSVPPYWQQVASGLILLGAVVAYSLRKVGQT